MQDSESESHELGSESELQGAAAWKLHVQQGRAWITRPGQGGAQAQAAAPKPSRASHGLARSAILLKKG
eukprot:7127-Chlamydomonas_euryale.AAC.1